ncbi:MAG: phosphate ABC transporter permease PstA [Candidatus Anstonellaceae archaeon]
MISPQFASSLAKRKFEQAAAFSFLKLCAIIVLAALFIVLLDIISKGASAISVGFLTESPTAGMSKGGIFPAIFGTVALAVGAIAAALPVGVITAIYLTEYAKEGKALRLVNSAISNLAGVPSIVFGLFGFALFVNFFGFGASILAGSLTLAVMVLPVIIKASEEALLSVPYSFREASLALGATKLETIWHHVLPYAMPGILTGAILALGRAAGETAPILFTAAAYFLPSLPSSIFDQTMALPYHLYILSTQSFNLKATQPMQYGTALVLLVLVLLLNLSAIILRSHYRRKYQW